MKRTKRLMAETQRDGKHECWDVEEAGTDAETESLGHEWQAETGRPGK
jgi:hypothetical protein